MNSNKSVKNGCKIDLQIIDLGCNEILGSSNLVWYAAELSRLDIASIVHISSKILTQIKKYSYMH